MSALALDARGRALKVAAHDLLADVTVKEAEFRLRKGKSQLYRCGSTDDEGNFLNLRDAVELERFASAPFVTMEMCRQAGGVFLRLPDSELSSGELGLLVIGIAEELGDVSAAVRRALADDDRADERECSEIEAEVEDVIDRAVQLRAHLRALQGKTVVPIGKGRA